MEYCTNFGNQKNESLCGFSLDKKCGVWYNGHFVAQPPHARRPHKKGATVKVAPS